jgi:hypothetical protein
MSVKAGAKIQCTCDKCKREFFFGVPLMEFEDLDEFTKNVVDTMNAEGWNVVYHSGNYYHWICKDCNK